MGDRTWSTRRVVIRHEHIPVQLLQPPARLKAVALDLAIKGHRVGYIPGAGDRVAEGLEEMGYEVTRLAGADLTPEKLGGLDAVVIGVRAYQRARLTSPPTCRRSSPTSRAAGRSSPSTTGRTGSRRTGLAPYDLRLSDARVTDEHAPVTFLAPDHPALTTPNKIRASDMEGWVQERGIYFPTQWDAHFTPILACGDPGETPLKGGLLVAKHGRATSSTRGSCSSGNCPPGCPGPTGSSPTWSRSANDLPRRRSSRTAALPAPRTNRRTRRPGCPGRAPGRASMLVVVVCFVLWVVLLVVLERSFS